MRIRSGEPAGPPLDAAATRTLESRVGAALALARRGGGGAFASVTVPMPAKLDVSAATMAARRPDDRFFCFEQPDRDG